ncbi:sodium/hydrogen exchanger 6-like isoform X1 [Centruroides vittatus]|uniref:sodium/hydrogen exchanger 6-like isoform X1 n=2 Tax=Centruroides vittatus TaxID=120091 RepID=UPI00350EE788
MTNGNIWLFILALCCCISLITSNDSADIKLDEKAKKLHQIDSLNILAYVFLLTLTVCTIWFFKRRRIRYLHETGLAVIYGLLMGVIIRYAGEESEVTHLTVNSPSENVSIPPDNIYLPMRVNMPTGNQDKLQQINKTYAYVFRGELTDVSSKKLDQKATFDPEIFFNIILPPVIFNAGYSLKKRYFFRNLGTIMSYAFLGTTISCVVIGGVMYSFLQLMSYLQFSFTDCLYFGAIISATDPVTVLAIFSDLHVDVNLYALVFGESVLNDAVAIVLSESISSYVENFQGQSGFEASSAFKSLGNFCYIFLCSFLIGSLMGCSTAALTKFTRLCELPLLESCLFFLMSYSTFLMAEAAQLTGIVAVLFCGICQAHYTYNNLSDESRARTKQLFELLSFLAESFIFTYIGVSMFTYRKHTWNFGFILIAFLAIAIGRALNIYPLTFLVNLGRHNKIPLSFQHILYFAGLRGAIAFALAIRNTLSEQRRLILTTTSLIAIVTVIICGGFTTTLLTWLGIPIGIEDEREMVQFGSPKKTKEQNTNQKPEKFEKAWLVRKWSNFDVMFMKPLLTHSRPTLMETLPSCCLPLARILTSTEQLSQDNNKKDDDSDTDLCINEDEISPSTSNHINSNQNTPQENYLKLEETMYVPYLKI